MFGEIVFIIFLLKAERHFSYSITSQEKKITDHFEFLQFSFTCHGSIHSSTYSAPINPIYLPSKLSLHYTGSWKHNVK